MSQNSGPLKPVRKPALRRCTGCMEMKDKRTLIRIVLKQDGDIVMDPTGKSNGRGAYICDSEECLRKAAGHKGLERSFKCAVPKEVYEKLKNQLTGE